MDKRILQIDDLIHQHILALVRQSLAEQGAKQTHRSITLTTSLERDLGIGSLEKAELVHRIEQAFAVRFADNLLTQSETIQDLIVAVQQAKPALQAIPQPIQQELAPLTLEPTHAQTLLEVLWHYAQYVPERPHIYLHDEQFGEKIITYGQLLTQANAVAAGLIQQGLNPGETVALMLPSSEAFFYGFFGVLLAGGIPVPIYPPVRANDIENYARRAAGILRNAEARFLFTFQQAETISKLMGALVPSLKAVTTVDAIAVPKASFAKLNPTTDEPALIQYTSGSTGQPKGVLLTHQNLLANIRAYGKAAAIKPDDVVVSWLPLYHDMGLIGGWLGSLYYGLPITILSPITFLTRPERWLWAIHYHRGTLSAAPNFAYELCVRKIDKQVIEGLDLSSWRLALNGAEAVYPQTLAKFTEKFSRYGFRKAAFFPAYGLAESAVALSFPSPQREPQIDRVLREPFVMQQIAQKAMPNSKDYLEFVSCGKPIPGHEIRIMDDQNAILQERQVGNLYFRGPSAMQGYYKNPQATQAVYHQGWWASGDLAYLADGELYIAGRKKDVIIKAGRNLYPTEIEAILNQIPELRKGCNVAFGVQDSRQGTEKLILVAEVENLVQAKNKDIVAVITERVAQQTGVPPDEVVLVAPRTVPKTSSGKLQRSACKTLYLEGKLTQAKSPVWAQLIRLFNSSLKHTVLHWLNSVGRFCYAVYVAVLIPTLLLPTYLLIRLLPIRYGAKLIKKGVSLFLRLAGCPIQVQGRDKLPQGRVLLVANHASYIDVLVLLAVLPVGVSFVGKRELKNAPLIGAAMQKLGYLFIERKDFNQSVTDLNQVTELLAQEKAVVIFPEGTFTYASGLRPFKLGAFKLAVETATAVCPVALQGTRKILRSKSWLPRPNAIRVVINDPIQPNKNDWDEAIRLRMLARTIIARDCGELPIDWVATLNTPKAE